MSNHEAPKTEDAAATTAAPPQPPRKSIARSAGIVGIAVMGSRILGLVREQVFATFFGAGFAMDAFLIAFRIPNLFRRLFAEGAFSAAFVPAFAGTLVAGLAAWRDRALTAFLGSTVALAGTLASAGVALFPFVLPSSLDPAASLSLWNAAASPLTLLWLYAAAAVLLPVVILYTAWVYAKLDESGAGPETGRGEARPPQER